MSDTSRKRSRKSKLVPRECAVGEDDLELQLPPAKVFKTMKINAKKETVIPEPTVVKLEEVDTSILKKINASVKEDTERDTNTSPRKFEINIEVESCGEDDEFANNKGDNRQSLVKAGISQIPIKLTRENIIEAADKILKSSTHIPDKILNIYVRNTIGYEHKDKVVLSEQENQIQEALDVWKNWQFRSFHREDPLFYKCYICTRSWWYLSDFRDHLASNHADDKKMIVSLERYETHEANLIAYNQKLLVVKDIYTEGLCYRCGKDYHAHEREKRYQQKFYINKGCNKQFFSCMGLRDHLPGCSVCKMDEKPFKCDICKLSFDAIEERNQHLVLCHSVRTDIPIMPHYKKCNKCMEQYVCSWHNCGLKEIECPHCYLRFPNVMALEVHITRSSERYTCEVCGLLMHNGCQKFQHMVSHTDNYMIVQKCLKCKKKDLNVFLDFEDAAAHLSLKHKMKSWDKNVKSYFITILVPSSSVYQSLAEAERNQQESKPEQQESVTEIQLRIPEEKDSVLKEESGQKVDELIPDCDQESVPETDQESIPETGQELDATWQHKLLQEDSESTQESVMENLEVKEESEDSPRLLIKEEPLDDMENLANGEENLMENYEQQIKVKEEYIEEEMEEEIDEYEGDIIKLNFDIEDLLVKQESVEEDYETTIDNTESDGEDSQESFPKPIKEEVQEEFEEDNDKPNKKLYRCTKCGFRAPHKKYRRHIEYDCQSRILKDKLYTCTKCKKQFSSMKKYLQHFEKHGFKRLSCPECLRELQTFSALGQHVLLHIKQNFIKVKMITSAGRAMAKPEYQCKKCSETVSIRLFFDHWELHVNSQPSHPVIVTSRPQQRRGEMHETIIKECIARLHRTPKECNYCHHRFKRSNECKRHIIEHLLADAYTHKLIHQELRCQVCDQGFPTPDKYKQHMRDHASLPVYKCELCDRAFSDSSNFTKHKKVHNLKVIICDLCGKKFQSKLSLEKHLEIHNTTEPITCPMCNKVFFLESAYRRHLRYLHEKPILPYGCSICNQRFGCLKLKWDHLWDVHKERKHKADCPICLKSFRKYSDVRAHARSEHLMEVSVLSVKKAKSLTVDVSKFMKRAPNIKAGVTETLVIYDSD